LPNLTTPSPCDLFGRGVLITRPATQAEELCRLVEAAGGRAICFPTVAIEPAGNPEPTRKLLDEHWDLILFISRNAVERALPLFPDSRLPTKPRLAAVGAATARALTTAGRAPDLMPSGHFDTESLLELSELENLTGQRVLIVRGEGGRTLLGDTLRKRGAELAYAQVYRRTLPLIDMTGLLARWRLDVHLVTATSGEVLDNLLALVGRNGRALLLATPLVVISERMTKMAENIGFTRVELAEQASDTAIVAALCRVIERIHGIRKRIRD